MTIADIKSGGWAVGERLRSTQMGLARTELLKCVDGTGGGVYTPSSTISIADLTIGGTDPLKYDARSVSGVVSLVPTYYDPAVWSFDTTNYRWKTDSTSAGNIIFAAKVPNPCTITDVSITCMGTGHAALPASMPTIGLKTRSIVTATAGADALSATDSSASIGVFDAVHTIVASGSVACAGENVFIRVTSESGANAAINFRILGIVLTLSMTEQHEWPG